MPFLERWERLKEGVKINTIERSSEILHYVRARERDLVEDLNYLCRLECQNPGAGTQDIDYIKLQLNQISEGRYRGVIISAEKVLFGVQPTKRALASEMKCAASKEIRSIQCGPILS